MGAIVAGAAAISFVTTRIRGPVQSEPPQPESNKPRPSYEKLEDCHWRVARTLKEDYFQDPTRLNNDVNLKPIAGPAPDSIKEIVIAKLYPDSFMYSVGFRTGDRILKVNGQPIISMKRALNLANEVRSTNQLTVQIERDGKVIDYRFDFE